MTENSKVEITKSELIEAVELALDSRARIDEHTHIRDHDYIDKSINKKHGQFVDMLIEKQRIKTERWEMIKTNVLTWGSVGLAAWLLKVLAKKFGFVF